ncbi:hypothetical protein DBR43_02325 [Pedobacter sp. KBW06]|uniref:hypothetical protein n=1 Tax=Pedobacter sp. KBW06 TaxID=2153359 RepID=UPI000F5945C2|nr:hypothetical protein [Pedobacter sp. KBW06]RQO74255.1 hypothetical protein DBR43_02325 [Pedobacter sp. KBW06]
MQPLKVIIENWQKVPWFTTWVPQIVGLIALGVSLYALDVTRKQFMLSTRPYIQAMNFWDQNENKQVNENFIFSLGNAPAKISKMDVKLYYKDQIVDKTLYNLVRFPATGSTWAYAFPQKEFDKLLNASRGDEANFFRSVRIEYTGINGGKVYFSELVQNFNGFAWQNVSEEAN